ALLVATRLSETTGKGCLYDGKFRISPVLQASVRTTVEGRRRRHWLVKIRQLGQIWARTGFHLENVGYKYFQRPSRRDMSLVSENSPYGRALPKIGRNEPCPCGSGKKFKRCFGKITLH